MERPTITRRRALMGTVTAGVALLAAACSGPASNTANPPTNPSAQPASNPSNSLPSAKPTTAAAPQSIVPLQATAAPSGQTITLSFELWDNNHFDVEQAMINEFEKAVPQIKIDVQHTVNNYLTKLETQLAGNAAPDVFWLSTAWYPTLATKDVLVDQSPMLSRDKISFQDYGPIYVNYFRFKGKQLGFPKDWDTVALLYNKDLFDKAGVPYPTDQWKWDPESGGDLLEAAKKLTTGSGPNRQYGFIGPVAGQRFWWNFVWMNGGDVLDKSWGKQIVLNSPEALAALQFCGDLAAKYQVSPAVEDYATQNADAMFWAGRAAMTTNGDWVLANYRKNIGTRFKWDVAPLPIGPKGRISETNSLGYGIWTGSKQQDAAWTYVKWLGKEGEIALAKGGAVFPAYVPAVDDFVSAMKDFNMKPFVDAQKNAHPIPESPYFNQLDDDLTKELTEVWRGKTTAKEAVDKVIATMTPVLAQGPDV
ncbi:MAG TPA: extracellular solute-binding protein [Chloroflexota bacterium]|nr:extracellular solute-binding protein [Chloroflexota bacterium]